MKRKIYDEIKNVTKLGTKDQENINIAMKQRENMFKITTNATKRNAFILVSCFHILTVFKGYFRQFSA